ncbi:MAG: hypothetical protein HY525_04475 [Betaproteobacteria bacterium]|nr:hypothetical protein [Betaproteobacteria bacterium]
MNLVTNVGFNSEGVRKQLSTQGVEPFTATPQQFVEFIKSEIAKWAKVIKDSGARVD